MQTSSSTTSYEKRLLFGGAEETDAAFRAADDGGDIKLKPFGGELERWKCQVNFDLVPRKGKVVFVVAPACGGKSVFLRATDLEEKRPKIIS